MADQLDKAIAEKRAEVENINQQVQLWIGRQKLADAELRALEFAAGARPAISTTGRRGRQPGAISAEWREVLSIIHRLGSVSYSTILEIASDKGLTTDIGNVRERVRSFVKNGLMDGDPDQGFRVTSEAVDRFGFGELRASS